MKPGGEEAGKHPLNAQDKRGTCLEVRYHTYPFVFPSTCLRAYNVQVARSPSLHRGPVCSSVAQQGSSCPSISIRPTCLLLCLLRGKPLAAKTQTKSGDNHSLEHRSRIKQNGYGSAEQKPGREVAGKHPLNGPGKQPKSCGFFLAPGTTIS